MLKRLVALWVYFLLLFFLFDSIRNEFFDIVVGYQLYKLDKFKYIVNCIALAIVSIIMPDSYDRPSVFVLWFVYLVHIVPSVLFFDAVVNIDLKSYWLYVFSITFCYGAISLLMKIKVKTLSSLNIGSDIFLLIIIVMFVIVSSLLYYNFGLPSNLVSVFDVYGVRSQFKAKIGDLNGYLITVSIFFLMPLMLLLSVSFIFNKKNYYAIFMLFLGSSVSLYLFLITGIKSSLFIMIMVLLFSFFLNTYRTVHIGNMLISMFIIAVIFGFALMMLFDFKDFLLHWLRRGLVLPGILSGYFYEYQSSYGFLRNESAPNVISKFYFNTDGSANSGVIGNGIYRYGIYLFPINILMLFLILKLIDFTMGLRNRNVIPLLLPVSYAISNSSISTIFLTYGFAPLLVFCFLFKNKFVTRF